MLTTSKPEQEHFGPAIRIDEHLAQNNPIVVDEQRIGENLQLDFPELTQDDWDNVLLYFTDRADIYDSMTTNMLLLRSSRSIKILGKIYHGVRKAITGKRYDVPSRAKQEALCDDHEVLVTVNTNPNINDLENPFNQEMDLSTFTAHELKHAASHLFANRVFKPQMDDISRLTRRQLRYLGSTAAGLTSAAAGTLGMIVAGSDPEGGLVVPWHNQEVFFGSSASIVGGLALVAAPIYLTVRHGALSPERFNLEFPEPPYSDTEECVHAYTLATRERWKGVVGTGE